MLKTLNKEAVKPKVLLLFRLTWHKVLIRNASTLQMKVGAKHHGWMETPASHKVGKVEW